MLLLSGDSGHAPNVHSGKGFTLDEIRSESVFISGGSSNLTGWFCKNELEQPKF